MRRYITIANFIFSLLLLSNLIATARGQSSGSTTATLLGRVKDEQGRVLAGAVVTATQRETNLVRTTTTDDDGSYILVQLPPGNYQVIAQANGFTRKSLPTNLTIGITLLIDFTLTVGSENEIIEVRADAATLAPDKTEKSTLVDESEILRLPINRRNFLDFTLITAGVVMDRIPLQGAQANSGLSFNGQNARQNNITIDGLDNNDLNSGSV
ncbi:MAG: carboxypeptidase-like regulatory domain-containing protein, partial [Acidobacteriota bacterium]